jgi:hypothetical protein
MVHTGIYQDETFQLVHRLVYTMMRTFQVKFILAHKSTSPVDLVYTLLGRAGSHESSRIAAAERHTNASRNHLLLFRGGGAAAAARRGRRSSRARSSRAGVVVSPPPPPLLLLLLPPPASPQPPSCGRGSRWQRCRGGSNLHLKSCAIATSNLRKP